eukprot:2647545-Lingulodinium_polyedra.AAC.1
MDTQYPLMLECVAEQSSSLDGFNHSSYMQLSLDGRHPVAAASRGRASHAAGLSADAASLLAQLPCGSGVLPGRERPPARGLVQRLTMMSRTEQSLVPCVVEM